MHGKHIIFIHGAWHNGTAFADLCTILNDRGHQVEAPTMKGHKPNDPQRSTITLDDYLDSIAAVVEKRVPQHGKAILVAHSSAGFLLQMVAPKIADRVDQLIFLNTWCLGQGESQADLIEAADPAAWAALKGAAEAAGDNCIPVIEPFVRGTLMAGEKAYHQNALLNTLVPQPLALMTTPVDVAAFKKLNIAKSVIYCKDDTSLPQGAYLDMAAQHLGSYDLHQIPGGHEAFFTHPETVANAVEKVAMLQEQVVSDILSI